MVQQFVYQSQRTYQHIFAGNNTVDIVCIRIHFDMVNDIEPASSLTACNLYV